MTQPQMLKSYKTYALLFIQLIHIVLSLEYILSRSADTFRISLVCMGFLIGILGVYVSSLDTDDDISFSRLTNIYILSSAYLCIVYIFSPLSKHIVMFLSFIAIYWCEVFVVDMIFDNFKSKKLEVALVLGLILFFAWVESGELYFEIYPLVFSFLVCLPVFSIVYKWSSIRQYFTNNLKWLYLIFTMLFLVMNLACYFTDTSYTYLINSCLISINILVLTAIVIYSRVKLVKSTISNILNSLWFYPLLLIILSLGFALELIDYRMSFALCFMVCLYIVELVMISLRGSSLKDESLNYSRLQTIKNLDKSIQTSQIIKDYLHDDVLQNLILVKKNMVDQLGLDKNDVNLNLIDELITSIRCQMQDISPTILKGACLRDSYLGIIDYTKNKYKNRVLLCEFFCDKNLFIPYPYDVLTYKFIGELLNNIYKHTDSNFATIGVSYENGNLNIYSYNDNGNISNESIDSKKNTGLVYIKNTVESLGGNFNIDNYEDGLKINMDIPIREEDFIENFINR